MIIAVVSVARRITAGPVEPWFSRPLGEPAWLALLDDTRRGEAPWAEALARWLPELIALDAVVAPPDPARLQICHRDLNAENVCRAAAGDVVVLDWENCGPAQPERELATIVWDLAADLSPQDAQAGYAAYLGSGGPARLSTATDFAMAAAVQGHLLQFYTGRALDPAQPAENRARSRARLDHMLRQPLTLPRVRDLLGLLSR
jgi:aminoglycoside phosphotransferase (APT) family kinase protein